jgi:hypothetical protein
MQGRSSPRNPSKLMRMHCYYQQENMQVTTNDLPQTDGLLSAKKLILSPRTKQARSIKKYANTNHKNSPFRLPVSPKMNINDEYHQL